MPQILPSPIQLQRYIGTVLSSDGSTRPGLTGVAAAPAPVTALGGAGTGFEVKMKPPPEISDPNTPGTYSSTCCWSSQNPDGTTDTGTIAPTEDGWDWTSDGDQGSGTIQQENSHLTYKKLDENGNVIEEGTLVIDPNPPGGAIPRSTRVVGVIDSVKEEE